MASLTQWTWVWAGFRSWWWTGKPGVLKSMGSQRVGHDWATELNWTELSQCIGASASASVLPTNIQDWFSLGLTGLISLLSEGLSGGFSSTTLQRLQFFVIQSTLWSNSHPYKDFPAGFAVKNLPGRQEPQETQVQSLSQEDPLGEGMAAHSSILAWRISWTEKPGRLQSMGLQRVRHERRNLACTHALTSVHAYWKNNSFD